MSDKKKKKVRKTYRSLRDADVLEAFLSCKRIGLTDAVSCQRVQVNRETLKHWKKEGRSEEAEERYLDFIIQYDQAETEAEGNLLSRILQAGAQDGDVKAAQWYLERKYPERYGKQARLEVTGKGGEELIPKRLFQSAVARAAGLAERRRRAKKKED